MPERIRKNEQGTCCRNKRQQVFFDPRETLTEKGPHDTLKKIPGREAESVTVQVEYRESGIRIAAEGVFAALMGISLLGSLAAMLTWSQAWVTPMWLICLRLAVTVLGLVLWNRKELGFRILAAYLVLAVLRLLVPSAEKLFDSQVSQTLFNGAWAFLGCYSLGHILGKERTARFLKIFLTGWVFCMACHSLVAVYAAWTDQKIWNIGQGAFWGLNIVAGNGTARLMLLFEPNTSGTLWGLAVTAAVLCIAGGRAVWFRILHGILLIPSWIALSLTDSRAAQVSTAAGIGLAVGILLLAMLRKKQAGKQVLSWSLACTAALVVTVACAALSSGTTQVFNRLKNEHITVFSGAEAESAEQPGAFEVRIIPPEATAGLNEQVSFTAETGNTGEELHYQWQYSADGETWQDIEGATGAALALTMKPYSYRRQYRCAVTAGEETVVSSSFQVLAPFSVKVDSKGDSRAEGDTVTLNAAAEGAEGTVSWQWQISEDGGKKWNDLPGETGNRLTVAVQGEKRYRCRATAENGIVVSGSKKVAEPTGTNIKSRGYKKEDLLNGRTKIWKQVLRFLKDHPRILVIGRSVSEPMKDTGIVRDNNILAEHCHNMFLQTVMESGIPGLLLMLAFMLCTGRRAVRVVTDDSLPLLLKLVPAAACSIWIGELVECIVRISNYRVPNPALLMLYAGVVCSLGRKGKRTGDVN